MSKFNTALQKYLVESGVIEEAPEDAVPANDPSLGEQPVDRNEITSNNVVTFASLLMKALQTNPDNLSSADKAIFLKQVTADNAMDIIKQVTNLLQTS